MHYQQEPLRILAVAETWQGSNAYAFVRSFRRAGHSVSLLADEWFAASGWQSRPMKAARRLVWPMILREATQAALRETEQFRPHLFFVFKGIMVSPQAIRAVQAGGGVAINFWPDTSFVDHGQTALRALPCYDWVFTTKTFGPADLKARFGITNASVLSHGFDPETHKPTAMDRSDTALYQCDASFIGTWSPKKEQLLSALISALPALDLKIWGSQWERAGPFLRPHIQGRPIFGAEYAKAIGAAKINIAILFEGNANAASGDRVTSRSFHIPASGGFMLHERSDEIAAHFTEDRDCAMFGSARELSEKVRFYLTQDEARSRMAQSGRSRASSSGYSIDDRARTVIDKARALLAARQETVAPNAANTFQFAPSEQASVGPPAASDT
ncbi:glycosyltransferase [Tianweitania sp. BSSL-BM11]|uniref:Glycosyltransferase n=1 Tax=Tianweitania aestuarii TaxID=2814886 RepID=A0ABS5RQY3_9HYPH|nr:glycosyltransferase [Tianweitania aestuarii]MBS9719460.1 glycosyltransferase [Tianweitania aestuarii]